MSPADMVICQQIIPTDRKRSLIVQQNQRKKSISVTKAAVISSAMLARKTSLSAVRGGPFVGNSTNGSGLNQQNSLNMPNKRDSMAAIADLLAATSGGQAAKLKKPSNNLKLFLIKNCVLASLDNPKADKLFQIACVLSLVTVCLHTPKTLQLIPILTFPILIVDSFVTIVFTIEAIIKAKHFGLVWASFY